MRAREGHGNGLSCVIAYISAKTGPQTASDYTHTSSVNFNPCKRKDWDKRMVLRVEVQSAVPSRESNRWPNRGGESESGQELASSTRHIYSVCRKVSHWFDKISVAFFLAYSVQDSQISIFWCLVTVFS